MGRLNRADKNYHLSAAALTDTGRDCLISSSTGGRNWKALIIHKEEPRSRRCKIGMELKNCVVPWNGLNEYLKQLEYLLSEKSSEKSSEELNLCITVNS